MRNSVDWDDQLEVGGNAPNTLSREINWAAALSPRSIQFPLVKDRTPHVYMSEARCETVAEKMNLMELASYIRFLHDPQFETIGDVTTCASRDGDWCRQRKACDQTYAIGAYTPWPSA